MPVGNSFNSAMPAEACRFAQELIYLFLILDFINADTVSLCRPYSIFSKLFFIAVIKKLHVRNPAAGIKSSLLEPYTLIRFPTGEEV